MPFSVDWTVTPVGPTNVVNTTAAGDQRAPEILNNNYGTRAVFYIDETVAGGQLLARLLADDGTPFGAPVTVASAVKSDRPDNYSVVALSNGWFVAAWASDAGDIYYRRFDSNLQPLSGPVLAENSADPADNPVVTHNNSGGVDIAWERATAPGESRIAFAYFSLLTDPPPGPGTLVSPPGGMDLNPTIYAYAPTDVRFAWDRAGAAIWTARYDISGANAESPTVLDAVGSANREPLLMSAAYGNALVYEDNEYGSGEITFRSLVSFVGPPVRSTYSTGSNTDINFVNTFGSYYGFLVSTNSATSGVEATLFDENSNVLKADLLIRQGISEPAALWIDGSHFLLAHTVPATGALGADGSGSSVAIGRFEMARVVTGSPDADTMLFGGTSFINNIHANGGNDFITTGSAADTVFGEEGDDEIFAADGNDVLDGGPGNDKLFGYFGDDLLAGGEGDDVLDGSYGNDVASGGAGNDSLSGGPGADQLYGDGGIDVIYAGEGDDFINDSEGVSSILAGESGNDQIYGGAGNDYVVGGDGNDTMVGFGGIDSLYGGTGDDYIVAGDGPGSVVDGGAGANTLWGAGGADYMIGGELADLIVGGAGSDYQFDNAGNDTHYGGQGTDYIYTNAGNDFVWTDDVGSPQSTDYFYAGGGTGVDTIADFTAGAGANHDVLVISLGSGVTTFARAQVNMSQVGVYTVLQLGADQVYIYNVQPFQLTADNFLFL